MQKPSTEMEAFALESLKIYFVKISKPRFLKRMGIKYTKV